MNMVYLSIYLGQLQMSIIKMLSFSLKRLCICFVSIIFIYLQDF